MPKLMIRDDVQAAEWHRLAKAERDGWMSRRLLVIANALDGMSPAEVARLAGWQTLRDWVIHYNEARVDRLADRWGAGRPPAVSEGQLATVKVLMILGKASWTCDASSPLRIADVADLIETRTGVRHSISGRDRVDAGDEPILPEDPPSHPKADPTARERFNIPGLERDSS